jgi:hypothetical protein
MSDRPREDPAEVGAVTGGDGVGFYRRAGFAPTRAGLIALT